MNKQLSHANFAYDEDFHAWAMWNAELLKKGKFSEIDAENIAEELESMGKRDKRQLVNRLIVVLIYLLKWEFQPEKRLSSWRSSIIEQRRRILQLLEDSPSLLNELDKKMDYAYQEAVKQASSETGIDTGLFPKTCPYSKEQILNGEFYPERIR